MAARTALVTGVSRRVGIGVAIVRRLMADGMTVFAQGWTPHDASQPWGADGVSDLGCAVVEIDLGRRGAASRLVARARRAVGPLDILVVNHARSSEQSLDELTEDELDACWRVNARAPLMLVKAFAEQHEHARLGGRVVLFTSGQHLGGMPSEIPYAVTKGTVHQMTATLAAALAPRGITVNTVNPGPTDTGWADDDVREAVAHRFPTGRWNRPEDAANVVAWLISDDAATVTGQVINAEGGFLR